uniref:Ion channel n=1 Tax=Candidatus Kentrum sp. DK TaxID=2126562 RepID=A0A450SCB4_9GAMM|nr:MAG: Ion channel [Candidatus Kentron sp. DK]
MSDQINGKSIRPSGNRVHISTVITIVLTFIVSVIAAYLGFLENEPETAIIMIVLVTLLISFIAFSFRKDDSENAFWIFVNFPVGVLFAGMVILWLKYKNTDCENIASSPAWEAWFLFVAALTVTAVSMFITVSIYSQPKDGSGGGFWQEFRELARKVVTEQGGTALMSFFTHFLVVTFLLGMSIAVADKFGICGDVVLIDVSEKADPPKKTLPKCENPRRMDRYAMLFEAGSSTPVIKLSEDEKVPYLPYKEGMALIGYDDDQNGVYILEDMNELVDVLWKQKKCDMVFSMEVFPNIRGGKVDGGDVLNLTMAEKRRVIVEKELHRIINEKSKFGDGMWRPWPRIDLPTSENNRDKYPVWYTEFFDGQRFSEQGNEKDFELILGGTEHPSKEKHVVALLSPISMVVSANRAGYKPDEDKSINETHSTSSESGVESKSPKRQESHKRFIDYLYFMIYTITTTGYGDLHPKGDFARLLVSIANLIEVFFGVIFINVLIAHGVALRYSGQFKQEDKKMLSEIKEDTGKLVDKHG